MAGFVLDRKQRPLMPCTPKRTCRLLACDRARMHGLSPFCIRQVDRVTETSASQPLQRLLDPGSKATGIADSRMQEVTNADGVVSRTMHIQSLLGLPRQGREIFRQLTARAAVNAARWALPDQLKASGLPATTGSSGQTRFNRSRLGLLKAHGCDAACLGNVADLRIGNTPTSRVRCTGCGARCKTRLNQFGGPQAYLPGTKTGVGFRRGDMVIANVPERKSGVRSGARGHSQPGQRQPPARCC